MSPSPQQDDRPGRTAFPKLAIGIGIALVLAAIIIVLLASRMQQSDRPRTAQADLRTSVVTGQR
jgi:hypothetical protein